MHPPPHRENTQVMREAITENDDDDDDDDDNDEILPLIFSCPCVYTFLVSCIS